MKYPIGTIVRLNGDVVIESQDPTQDLREGSTAIILGQEEFIFDPDDPENSTDTVYSCLVGGKVQHLFEVDFELVTTETIEA